MPTAETSARAIDRRADFPGGTMVDADSAHFADASTCSSDTVASACQGW